MLTEERISLISEKPPNKRSWRYITLSCILIGLLFVLMGHWENTKVLLNKSQETHVGSPTPCPAFVRIIAKDGNNLKIFDRDEYTEPGVFDERYYYPVKPWSIMGYYKKVSETEYKRPDGFKLMKLRMDSGLTLILEPTFKTHFNEAETGLMRMECQRKSRAKKL